MGHATILLVDMYESACNIISDDKSTDVPTLAGNKCIERFCFYSFPSLKGSHIPYKLIWIYTNFKPYVKSHVLGQLHLC